MTVYKDTKISILGDGGWGTTLALLLAEKGYEVRLWGAFPEYVEEIRRKRENVKFLPGFRIPEKVRLTPDIHEACRQADIAVLAAPSQFMRGVLKKIGKTGLRHLSFVSVAKGIETKSLKTMSQVVADELGRVPLSVISGPCIAREVALKMPSAASVASNRRGDPKKIRKIFETAAFSLFENDDLVGVELGGSIKNVIAICSGIVEGLGFGANTRAVLFARGLAEMARLGTAMGARRETFMGLSGLGDLTTTCLSPQSRNRWLGKEIAKGVGLKYVLKGTEMVVEGVATAEAATRLARKHKIAMPISEAVYHILFKGAEPRQVVKALMHREPYKENL